ncbi:hypothetical protein [Candidatus Palauibacter sp.]|uniref:hypothetical protein n=1 Tax=Candidatus Palauibacter sp. TaxID=3101350 RepID=UPI003B0288EE
MFTLNLFSSAGGSAPGGARTTRRGRAAFAACLLLVTMAGAAPGAEAPPAGIEPAVTAAAASSVLAVQTCDAILFAARATCYAAELAAAEADTPAQQEQARELERLCGQLRYQVFVCAFF